MTPGRDALGRCAEPLFQLMLRLLYAPDHAEEASRLHGQCCRELEQFADQATQLDVQRPDAEEARYALVALLDEVAVQRDGAIRDYWLPRSLQMRFSGENVAGEGFFERLGKLRHDAKRRHVLRLYYLCLLFGFRGKYRLQGSELELLEIEDSVRTELRKAHAIPSELVLAPSGRRPRETLADTRKNRLLLIMAAGSAGASLLLYVGLRLSLLAQTEQLVERIAGLLGA